MMDLGSPGGQEGAAYNINDAGQVVGSSKGDDGNDYAFRWTSTGGILDLNSLLSPGDQAAWKLAVALDINNDGHVVGYGTHDGEIRAFLLIPEPATLSLLALVGAALLRRTKK